jgi:glucose-6-phosphate-specific signal transduction histidine kinase
MPNGLNSPHYIEGRIAAKAPNHKSLETDYQLSCQSMSKPHTADLDLNRFILESMPVWAWPLLSALYALAWFLLLIPSQSLWFLPAGLRIAVLWLLPRKRWAWQLLGEGLVGVALVMSSEELVLNPNFIALSLMPWLVYASVIGLLRGSRSGMALNTPRNMFLFISCCALSAMIVSPILSALYRGDAFTQMNADPNSWSSIFGFAYGDFIGQLTIAPLLVMLCARQWKQLREIDLWFFLVMATAFSFIVLLILHYRQELAPFLLLLVFAPMSVIAFRKNWVGAALSITITGVLFEVYLQHNRLPLEMVINQLAFALFAASSLMLGAAMTALRDTVLSLRQQHENMALVNRELLTRSEELREVTQRLVRMEEQGQRELADELDVELGQSLHTLGTHLGMAVRSVREQDTLKTLFTIRDKTREMEDSLRRVLRQLRPKALDNKGLKEAINNGPLHEVLDDAGVAMETNFVGNLTYLDEDEKTAIYRICQAVTRQAVGVHGLKKLRVSVQVNDSSETGHDVTLDIELGPIQSERRLQLLLPLRSIQDRVLSLKGVYDVSARENILLHSIRFMQKAASNR